MRMGGRRIEEGEDVGDDTGEDNAEKELASGRKMWLLAAGAGLVAYTLLSGVVRIGGGETVEAEEGGDGDEKNGT